MRLYLKKGPSMLKSGFTARHWIVFETAVIITTQGAKCPK